MAKKVYEILWEIHCGEFEFIQRNYKVFSSYEEATEYGSRIEYLENDGKLFEEKANEGYYFELMNVIPIDSIDGCKFELLHA